MSKLYKRLHTQVVNRLPSLYEQCGGGHTHADIGFQYYAGVVRDSIRDIRHHMQRQLSATFHTARKPGARWWWL